jgi:hypothetical protein
MSATIYPVNPRDLRGKGVGFDSGTPVGTL